MSTPLRVAAFVLALAGAFAAALGVGRVVGPIDVEPAAAAHDDSHDDSPASDQGDAASAEVADVGGLTSRADGFTLTLADRTLPAGRTRLDFTVVTSSGRPLLDYTREHELDLHLIVVRRDLTGFQHVHPTLDTATGTWSTDVRLTPGTWRVIADFAPAGWEGITLADDVAVAGDFRPGELPADDRTATVSTADGTYTVTLDGDTAPGASTLLTTRIELDGEPVTDLEPYLGAFGHLVALRAGDLGYLHVHPEEGEAGPGVEFATAFPTPGTYRLFLDFQHRGVVHTAAFTVESGGAPGHPVEEGEGHEH